VTGRRRAAPCGRRHADRSRILHLVGRHAERVGQGDPGDDLPQHAHLRPGRAGRTIASTGCARRRPSSSP